MNNKEAIEYFRNYQEVGNIEQNEAYDLAIKALEERPTTRHVKINHPRFGKIDGWYDETRQVVFHGYFTKELMDELGWDIEEAEND